MKYFISIILIVFLSLFSAGIVSADANVAESSATIKTESFNQNDIRIIRLGRFLASYNSPLIEYAPVFVQKADKYNIDWRLVASISGVESTFGKQIPYNSYNAYGWANGEYRFASWEESIEIVSKTLREKYLNKGANTIDQIARRYAPPSLTWAGKTKFFMRKIEVYPLEFTLEG